MSVEETSEASLSGGRPGSHVLYIIRCGGDSGEAAALPTSEKLLSAGINPAVRRLAISRLGLSCWEQLTEHLAAYSNAEEKAAESPRLISPLFYLLYSFKGGSLMCRTDCLIRQEESSVFPSC